MYTISGGLISVVGTLTYSWFVAMLATTEAGLMLEGAESNVNWSDCTSLPPVIPKVATSLSLFEMTTTCEIFESAYFVSGRGERSDVHIRTRIKVTPHTRARH